MVVGGSSLIPGFAQRLKQDLQARILSEANGENSAMLHPELSRTDINMVVDSMRKYFFTT